MSDLMWQSSVEIIQQHVVKISTPTGSGTGFQISTTKNNKLCAVATAAHVINHAHYWENPIRLHHQKSDTTILLKPEDRSIIISPNQDTAAIVFLKEKIPFPETTLGLTTEEKYVKIGNELGWLGYPAVSPSNLCMFSGRISCYLEEKLAYLVNGVAINGVSGGPAFLPISDKHVILTGVVSAYIANRATGETLPGLCVVQDVSQFHDISKKFKSIDEAKKEETSPEQPKEEKIEENKKNNAT